MVDGGSLKECEVSALPESGMTPLDLILLSRADEQMADAWKQGVRICKWRETPCATQISHGNKTGLCQVHGNLWRGRSARRRQEG